TVGGSTRQTKGVWHLLVFILPVDGGIRALAARLNLSTVRTTNLVAAEFRPDDSYSLVDDGRRCGLLRMDDGPPLNRAGICIDYLRAEAGARRWLLAQWPASRTVSLFANSAVVAGIQVRHC